MKKKGRPDVALPEQRKEPSLPLADWSNVRKTAARFDQGEGFSDSERDEP